MEEQAGKPADDESRGGEDSPHPVARAEPLDSEEQRAAEQWLRRIPDDPAGLLRRKFLYQYNQRAGQSGPAGTQTW
jgi:Ca-activated chloride channel family protein